MKNIDNYIQEKLYIGKGYQAKPNADEIIDFLNPSHNYKDKLREKLEKWIEDNNHFIKASRMEFYEKQKLRQKIKQKTKLQKSKKK